MSNRKKTFKLLKNKASKVHIHKLAKQVDEFGQSFGFDRKHAYRVANIAINLFDELQPLHNMGNTERIWLWTAAILHDIAKKINSKTHNKIARNLIIRADELPFTKKQRMMIALVVRYHKGMLPSRIHRHYRYLNRDNKLCVKKLAAILRIADGLDKNDIAEPIKVDLKPDKQDVLFHIITNTAAQLKRAVEKADLFTLVFNKDLVFSAYTRLSGDPV